MTAPTLDLQIENLKALRLDCAVRSQVIAERELTSRQLRLEIEQQFQASGKTKTDAEKYAKADPQYLTAERETIRLTFERERVLAEIESVRLGIDLQLAILRREAVGI